MANDDTIKNAITVLYLRESVASFFLSLFDWEVMAAF